jgi:hypothetical protein
VQSAPTRSTKPRAAAAPICASFSFAVFFASFLAVAFLVVFLVVLFAVLRPTDFLAVFRAVDFRAADFFAFFFTPPACSDLLLRLMSIACAREYCWMSLNFPDLSRTA